MGKKVIVSEETINRMIIESTNRLLRENGIDEKNFWQKLGSAGAGIANGINKFTNNVKTGFQQMRDQYRSDLNSTGAQNTVGAAANNVSNAQQTTAQAPETQGATNATAATADPNAVRQEVPQKTASEPISKSTGQTGQAVQAQGNAKQNFSDLAKKYGITVDKKTFDYWVNFFRSNGMNNIFYDAGRLFPQK